MPELSKDSFGDDMARAFVLAPEAARSGHRPHHRDPSPQRAAAFFEPDYIPMLFKSGGGGGGHYPPSHSSKFEETPALGEDIADFFCPTSPASLWGAPFEAVSAKVKPGANEYAAGGASAAVPHPFQHLQLDDRDIDDDMWNLPDLQLPRIGGFGLTSSPSFSHDLRVPLSSPAPAGADSAKQFEATTPPRHPSIPAAAVAETSSPEEAPRKNAASRKSLGVKSCPKLKKPRKVANADQVEHVRRERQRRDDMTLKISTLECLLPPAGPNLKRDRASVVHDSVQYVKSLQTQVEELEKTFAEMKANRQARPCATRAAAWSNTAMKEPCKAEADGSSEQAKLVEFHVQVEGHESTAILNRCRCRPDYMSCAMRAFEQLDLDVIRSTVTRMCNYTILAISTKPRLSSIVVSPSSILATLMSSTGIS